MSTFTPPQLNVSTLTGLHPYLLGSPWRDPGIGIVHLGLGNFHRAHQALYTEEAMISAGGDWGICGVLMRGDVEKQRAFAAQDGLYSLLERGPEGTRVCVIRSVRETLVMPNDIGAILAWLRSPEVKIVSLTVTEKGYCLDRSGDKLDTMQPDVLHDLEHPHTPVTVPGLLVAALKQRREKPFAVLSCDNLQHNGATLRNVVLQFARLLDPALSDWIAESVAFPSTMVDRITPAATESDSADAARQLGVSDALPVSCEPFRQWVIEDRFPLGRPAWETAGAQIVANVAPFEQAKLRMLNGAHSAIAYLSMLADLATVEEAMAHGPMRALIRSMMTEEIAPTLAVPETFDRLAYRDALLARFANPALKHRCEQIAMDGSQKLPQRLLAPIRDRLEAGAPLRRLALAVGAWMRFLRGVSDRGNPYPIIDPLSGRLVQLARTAGDDPAAMVHALLGVREIFPEALACQETFVREVRDAVTALQAGVRTAIDQYC